MPQGVNARAMIVAWEQIAFWESHMTATEAGIAVGLSTESWQAVAKRLSKIWVSLQQNPPSVDALLLTKSDSFR